MHALHRPHLPRAVMITVIAAALATALALALATRVNDLSFTRMPTGAAAKRPTVQAQAASREWTLSPFKPLLSARGLAVGVGTAKAGVPSRRFAWHSSAARLPQSITQAQQKLNF